MEPPAKRIKVGLYERQDDEANDDELSLTPSEFAARQDPLYQLDKGRAKAASKLQSRFENIFEKYGQDFDGVGDEINLHTGEVAIDNGHLKSLEDDRDKEVPSGDEEEEEEEEEEHILQPKRQPSRALSLARPPPPPALSPEHSATLAFLQQSGWTPPPGVDVNLSALSGLSNALQLFGTPNPLNLASSLFGPGPAPLDPLWQTPELPKDSPHSRLGPFGAGYAPQHGQQPALGQLFAHHAQRKTTSARSLNLKRKTLLDGTLAQGDENIDQDGKIGDSVNNANDHDDDEDDLLLGSTQKHVRPAPLLKKAAKGTAASSTTESSASAKVESDPPVSQDKTRRLPKGPKKHVKSNEKKATTKRLAKTTGSIGKKGKVAGVPLALQISENENESRDTAALAATAPVQKKRGRPSKPKESVTTQEKKQKMQTEEDNADAVAPADGTSLSEAEPGPVADALPEIHPEAWDEEAVNAQLMQAVNEALVLVTSPMKSWPEANLGEEVANEGDRLAGAANGSVSEHQDTDMSDAVTPKPRAKANGHRPAELPAPADTSTEADETALPPHPKEVWARNRTDPSFVFSDDEDEVDFRQSWGPPGDNNPDLFKDASPEAPALATDAAGAADPVEDPAAVTVPETRHYEPGLEEPSYVNTVQLPPTEAGSEIAKSSSVTTLEISHSLSPSVEAEAETLKISAPKTSSIPTAAESPDDGALDNEKAPTPRPKRRGRPSLKGRIPNARAAETSMEAPINTDGIPTAVDSAKGEARKNAKSRTPPPKRRGRSSHKGRVPEAQTAATASPPLDIAGSAEDRAIEPQSPPADFSSPRDRVTEKPEPPPRDPAASPGIRDRRGTPGRRKDRPTGSGKNTAPTSGRHRVQTPVQEKTQAEFEKRSPIAHAKRRRSTLTSLVPDLPDDDVEAVMVWSNDTPASSSFASSLRRAAAHTAHPSPKTPLGATSRHHGLLLGSAGPRPSPVSAVTPEAGSLSSSARLRRGSSKLAGSTRTSPLIERVLKTTPRDGGGGWGLDHGKKKAATSGDATIRTPGGASRRCGVDGFVCARDFCFACCK